MSFHSCSLSILLSVPDVTEEGPQLRSTVVLRNCGLFSVTPYIIMLSTLCKTFSRPHISIFFLFFPENRIWPFMQIVSVRGNLHQMSYLVFFFLGKIRKISPICKNIGLNTLKKHMFWTLLESPHWGNSNKYPKHVFYEAMKTRRPFSHINLLIKYSVQQHIHFNGNVFGNKCCPCDESLMYTMFTQIDSRNL